MQNKKAAQLKKAFIEQMKQEGKLRIYKLPEKNNHAVHIITPQGSQRIYTATKNKRKINFELSGFAESGFDHREVYNGLKRKGLGTKMLKVHEAIERKYQEPLLKQTTARKSTALFLIKNGYEIFCFNPEHEKSFKDRKINNTQDLKQYLEKNITKEELPFLIGFRKKTKGNRKKID